ncbi:MAG TPA: sigma 54-interacting transcriptional regulator [Vicinamibacterales bacterium]|nr:sigma 54-interacting transcriptional regulator [Vicinamibacterales bacterium]
MPDNVTLAADRFGRTSTALELVGRSPAIKRVQEFVRRAATLDGGVLITAEAGAAVESVVRELHTRGRRASGPFVVVECGTSDPAPLEHLLFGLPDPAVPSDLEMVTSDSRVAAARGGTLFLADVGDLPAAAQRRLARIARDGEVSVDGADPVTTGFRLVASAAPGIDAEVEAHRFRADLFRRLSAVRIDLPPLRERPEDIPVLAVRLLDDICAARGLSPHTLTETALALVGALTWPGNLTELRTAIERAATECRNDVIQIEQLLPSLPLLRASARFTPKGNLREARLRFEREYISAMLQHHGWRMADAANALGIQRPNLYRKARQLGIPLSRVPDGDHS